MAKRGSKLPALSESTIRQQTTAQSFQRGKEYYRSGAVISLVQRGDQIQARVRGSDYEPYQVSITFNTRCLTGATCTCPYDWGGWCKHIVAVLLTCLHKPTIIRARPPLEETLASLKKEQLQALLLNLAARYPGMVDEIENKLDTPKQSRRSKNTQAASPTAIDPHYVRGQVHSIVHSLDHMRRSQAYWQVGRVVDQVRQLLELAKGPTALDTLAAITDEYIKEWTILDDSDGEASGLFEDLENAWSEAILATDLTPTKCRQWARQLRKWQRAIEDYGMEGVFEEARLALAE